MLAGCAERRRRIGLRAGLITSAAKTGISSWKIREQTGHKSDAMLQRYIRDADIIDAAMAMRATFAQGSPRYTRSSMRW
jgi:hypothetical protein